MHVIKQSTSVILRTVGNSVSLHSFPTIIPPPQEGAPHTLETAGVGEGAVSLRVRLLMM
jgi:hypothetical protein